jgi:signal transduction histidine kinase
MLTVNILLVDDDIKTLAALEAILVELKVNVVKANSGTAALKYLLEQDFAVILLDVQMKDMDGFETATLIRERPRSQHTPIIFLTAHDQTDSFIFKGYSVGAVDYLFKPVPTEILRAKVSIFIDLYKKTLALQHQLDELNQLHKDTASQRQINDYSQALLDYEHTAREEAEQSLQAHDEFVTVAAHELRTPITSLRGFTQSLIRRLDKGKIPDLDYLYKVLRSIDMQSQKLGMLVTQLLDISRIREGQLELDLELTDIAPLVKTVVETLQATTNRHSITTNVPFSLFAIVDPLRIEQVLINLLGNAIKYTPEDKSIDVDVNVTEHQTFSLSVTDQGIGIPPEQREHLFERFHRAHPDGSISGMGLGLYISQQIIQLHGGTLYAEFPDEGGTRFIMELPLAQSATQSV